MKRGQLIDVIEKAKGMDDSQKLKALLFALGLKPSTYIKFKVKTLNEPLHFEKHLNGFLFDRSSAKSYEEIDRISKNKIKWKMKGVWYGYDLFQDRKAKQLFEKYKKSIKKSHSSADKLGGQLYHYPACCVKKHAELQNQKILAKKHTYKSFFETMHKLERAFPFVQHVPCSLKCKRTRTLNSKYRAAIKKHAPKFYKKFTKKTTFNTALLVEFEVNGVWPKRTAHEYRYIALKPRDGHYYLFSDLTSEKFARGSVVSGKVTMQYNTAKVIPGKLKKIIPDIHHERKFLLPGRAF